MCPTTEKRETFSDRPVAVNQLNTRQYGCSFDNNNKYKIVALKQIPWEPFIYSDTVDTAVEFTTPNLSEHTSHQIW